MSEKNSPQLDANKESANAISSVIAPVRGRRYPIRMTLRYRTEADTQWQEARTVNISRTGVLFRTNNPLDIQTTLQMILLLPPELGGDDAAEVLCLGRIVRTVPPRSPDGPSFIAATISDYQFARK